MSEQQGGVVSEVQAAAGKRTPQDAELAAMKKIDSILSDLTPGAAQRVLQWAQSRTHERLYAKEVAVASPALKAALVGVGPQTARQVLEQF